MHNSRKGCGCVDMVFAARQLLEKTREHDDTLFVLFGDLWKAYDSVPKLALWRVMERYGVPPTMSNVVKLFHEGMRAEVRVGTAITDSFEVKNGLSQGCTLPPTLFNIYLGAMVASWRAQCSPAGVSLRFKNSRRLVRDRTAK